MQNQNCIFGIQEIFLTLAINLYIFFSCRNINMKNKVQNAIYQGQLKSLSNYVLLLGFVNKKNTKK